MVIWVEACVGATGGKGGIEPEAHALIIVEGYEDRTGFPFDGRFVGRIYFIFQKRINLPLFC